MFLPHVAELLLQAFPGKPKFTDADVPDLTGKVCIVTGGNAGVGASVSKIMYAKNATVYIASRSEKRGAAAIDSIKQEVPHSKGRLAFIRLDLSDLETIGPAADAFLRKEDRLDILVNNAGLAGPGKGGPETTKQGYSIQVGANCLGHFAFTRLLTPILEETASTAPEGSVRIVWVSSSAAFAIAPSKFMDTLDRQAQLPMHTKYFGSKLGNYLHATEFATRYKNKGIVSLSVNPGNLNSSLWQGAPRIVYFFAWFVLHPPLYGAYTELFAAFSPQVTLNKTGSHLSPWGRFRSVSSEMSDANRTIENGGSGIARDFWEWSATQVDKYAPVE